MCAVLLHCVIFRSTSTRTSDCVLSRSRHTQRDRPSPSRSHATCYTELRSRRASCYTPSIGAFSFSCAASSAPASALSATLHSHGSWLSLSVALCDLYLYLSVSISLSLSAAPSPRPAHAARRTRTVEEYRVVYRREALLPLHIRAPKQVVRLSPTCPRAPRTCRLRPPAILDALAQRRVYPCIWLLDRVHVHEAGIHQVKALLPHFVEQQSGSASRAVSSAFIHALRGRAAAGGGLRLIGRRLCACGRHPGR